ncbi:MAG: hypothetical protein ABH875_07720 [Candidatus Omnitrophota bacterium]
MKKLLCILVFMMAAVLFAPHFNGAGAKAAYREAQQDRASEHGYIAGDELKWLSILTPFAIASLIFLIVSSFGGSDAIPDNLEGILLKLSVGIIATTVCLYIYAVTKKPIFMVMIRWIWVFFVSAMIFSPVAKMARTEHKKRYRMPSSKEFWICRRCGEENHIIYTQCESCKGQRETTGGK